MNNVQRFGAAAAVATVLAIGTSPVQAEGFPVPPSPTNPNPPMDQARSLAKPVFIAQAKPRLVAQGNEQPESSLQLIPTSNNEGRTPSPDAQGIAKLNQQSRDNQEASAQNLRNRRPIPGGE